MNVAVLFTDIVGFTKLSEKMKPNDVLQLLSEYQSIMVDCIFEFNGTVDKFIGDAVMANFGTPKSAGNDAQNAFDCALTMNKKLKDWNKLRNEQGLQQIGHRVVRGHGNFIEYAPLFFILLYLAEEAGTHNHILHSLAIMFMIGRLMHGILFSFMLRKSIILRGGGIFLTMLALGLVGLLNFVQYVAIYF